MRAANGDDIDRGFAESVEYADTTDTTLTLGSITDAHTRRILRNPEISSGYGTNKVFFTWHYIDLI